jgi:hypothetical protein
LKNVAKGSDRIEFELSALEHRLFIIVDEEHWLPASPHQILTNAFPIGRAPLPHLFVRMTK